MAGLASLTANYTDSEDEGLDDEKGEDEVNKDSPEFGGVSGPPSIVDRFRDTAESRENTPISISSKHSETSRSNRSTPVKKPTRLVSYIDPEDEDDAADRTVNDEDGLSMDFEKNEAESGKEDKNSEPVPMDLDSESESAKKEDEEDSMAAPETTEPASTDKETVDSVTGVVVDAWTEGVKLPPEPPGECSAKLQENINRLYEKKKRTNFDMNAVIQNKKAFRNPSIYEKLIQFCGIDEHGTNFPKELYDGHLFGKESYYDELAKVQKADMDRREKNKDRAGNVNKSAVEVASAAAALAMKKLDETKRKSKWDQGPVPHGGLRPTSSSAPPSTLGKSIPAFGTLTKKH